MKVAVAAAAPTAGDGFVDLPVSDARREIAARLTASKQQVPHYYLTVDVEVPAPPANQAARRVTRLVLSQTDGRASQGARGPE